MLPILGRYGPFFLYSYTVVLSLGILAGLGLTAWQVRSRPGTDHTGWLDAALASLAAAILGGRIAFVLAHAAYYQTHPAEAWQLWQGGLSVDGAIPAGMAGLWLWSQFRRRPFVHDADWLAPAGALLACFGWLACWLAACAYGRQSSLGLFTADLPDAFGVGAVRYQTQLLGFVYSLLAFGLVWWQRGRLRPGQLFWLTVGLISTGRALVSLWRADPVPQWGALRLDTLLAAGLAITALAGFITQRQAAP